MRIGVLDDKTPKCLMCHHKHSPQCPMPTTGHRPEVDRVVNDITFHRCAECKFMWPCTTNMMMNDDSWMF